MASGNSPLLATCSPTRMQRQGEIDQVHQWAGFSRPATKGRILSQSSLIILMTVGAQCHSSYGSLWLEDVGVKDLSYRVKRAIMA